MDNLYDHIEKNLSISITDNQQTKLVAYEVLLREWNEKLNLTAITDRKEFWYKHIYDSLTCLKMILSFGAISLIDIGTGAGFPGIPLKIVYPEICLTLAESVRKKASFCQTAVNTLNLSNVTVIAERAETIGQDKKFRERYDWSVARAVAPLQVLAEYLLPLVHIGGSMLAQKGSNVDMEIGQADNAIRILGGKLDSVIPITLPNGMGEHTLVRIQKISPTPIKYPRRPGTPKKSPL